MLNIVICDDEVKLCEEIVTLLKNYSIERNIAINIQVFYSAKALEAFFVQGNSCDIILLDIEMDDMTGIEFGYMLRDHMKDNETRIVYISWNDSYAFDLIDARPFAYLIKPIEVEKLNHVIDEIYDIHDIENKFLYYRVGEEHRKLLYKKIIYIEGNKRRTGIHTAKDVIEISTSFDKVILKLEPMIFWRIHKSYVINQHHAENFKYSVVTMDNQDKLSISQNYRTKIKNYRIKYWG